MNEPIVQNVQTLDGATLWCESRGQGTHALVLLHGFSFDATTWDDQFDALADCTRVVRYDLRGFGRSSRPSGAAGQYVHVADLLALCDALGIASARLVGLSLGANVALAAALAHPARVAALVLAAPGLPGHVWSTPRPPEETAEYARKHGIGEGRRFWYEHPLFETARALPDVAARLHAVIERYDGWQWRSAYAPAAAPLTARLVEVRAPTLVLHGALDLPGYREIAMRLAREIPGANRIEFEDAGHLINMERPVRFNREVASFVAGITHRIEIGEDT